MLQSSISLITACLLSASLTAADWPGFLGPDQRGDAGPTPAIDNFEQARQLWQSADTIPDGRTSDPSDKNHETMSGGYGSPVIAGKRVYLGYYVPAGDTILKWVHDKAGGPAHKWSVESEDVVHCFDLASGETLWRQVCPGRGLNLNFGNKAGGGQTVMVRDGRVYHLGMSGIFHCLDAASGKLVWSTPLQPKAGHVELARAAALARAERNNAAEDVPPPLLADVGGLYSCNRSYLGFPVWAAGVLVMPDFVQATHPTGGKRMPLGGVAGFDPASGRQLWHVDQCNSGRFINPLPITLDGAEYILAIDGHGATLIAPADGKVLWRHADVNHSMGTPILWKDMVAVIAAPGERVQAEAAARMERGASVASGKGKTTTLWKGFRIATAGPQLVWTGAAERDNTMGVAVRDGIAYPVVTAGNGAAVWALDVANGTGTKVAKPGVAGGEHDNMFTMLVGDRLIACLGGNSGAGERDAFCMYTLTEAGRKLELAGAPLRGRFAWGYANAIMPAIADGIMVARTNTHLVAYDLRASR